MRKKEFKKRVDRLWVTTKKDLNNVLKDGTQLLKQGEIYIKDQSEKGKRKLEAMTLALEREKLYYELGKSLASQPKGRFSKKSEDLLIKIKKINRNIKKA